MFMLDGKPLPLDVPFTHNEIQYPNNWLRLAGADEKSAIGITEVSDPAPFDDRFYWSPGNPKQLEDETFTSEDGETTWTQRGLKYNAVQQIKATAHSLLAPTDWAVLRQLLKGVGMSAHIENYRNAVVDASNQFEQQINACTSVDELAALQLTWPNQADF